MGIKIDGNDRGRIFQGIGAVFSNGMTKLLEDYPEKQRQDILRFLFAENFGASLQHIKVEIGSDVNTSSGTVPSHMRARDDLDMRRGSELWIAALAKEINPKITTEALRWGTPAWIENDEDKYLYYLNFIRGAEESFGIRLDYLGCDQNEGSFDRDWVVNTLKPGLVRDGYGDVKLVAAESDRGWEIAEEILRDGELREAVDVLNCHYTDESAETARNAGKPLWAGEHLAPVRHDFVKGALGAAYHMLSMYPLGGMTMYEMHPALEGNYGATPFQYKGILAASWPWSGHYEVTAGLWTTAHFTQFIKPGWQYLDGACRAGEAVLEEEEGREEAGFVSLRAPDGKNWSAVFVNCCGREKRYEIEVTGGLDCGRIYVWTTDRQEYFVRKEDIVPVGNSFTLTIPPFTVCSVTTTRGQKKGEPVWEIPEEKTMALPWEEDYSAYETGAQPKYASDQGGAFAVEGGILYQQITRERKPVDWVYRTTPYPCTLLGSELWTDYRVRAELSLPAEESFGYVGGRSVYIGKFAEYPSGYLLCLAGDGGWELRREAVVLQSGDCSDFEIEVSHELEIAFHGDLICAFLDGRLLARVRDSHLSAGQAVLGSSYHRVGFANLRILPGGMSGETAGCSCVGYSEESAGSSCGGYSAENAGYSCRRYSVKDSRILLRGPWRDLDGDYANYERTLRGAETQDACLEFSFHGTGVCVIGNRDRIGGQAEVAVDGRLAQTVDTYTETECDRKTKLSVPRTRNAIAAVYGLAPGVHRLELRPRGTHSAFSEGCQISVEAVEITGGEGLLDAGLYAN